MTLEGIPIILLILIAFILASIYLLIKWIRMINQRLDRIDDEIMDIQWEAGINEIDKSGDKE